MAEGRLALDWLKDHFEHEAKEDRFKPIKNNETLRPVSDALDSAMGWGGYSDSKASKTRAVVHWAYHYGNGVVTDNQREKEHAKDKLGQAGFLDGKTTHLKEYDEAKKKEKEAKEAKESK